MSINIGWTTEGPYLPIGRAFIRDGVVSGYIMRRGRAFNSLDIMVDRIEDSKYFNLSQLVEVTLSQPSYFLIVAETLTRMGEPDGNCLTQICYIFAKRGKYFITHINEMKKLDGEHVTISEEDIGIRNLIANLLSDWGLITLVDSEQIRFPVASTSKIKIIPRKDKEKWKLVSKYDIGKRK